MYVGAARIFRILQRWLKTTSRPNATYATQR